MLLDIIDNKAVLAKGNTTIGMVYAYEKFRDIWYCMDHIEKK
jgi:hypothetical protein